MIAILQLLRKLFSSQCRLTSLRLDMSSEFGDGLIHRCFATNSSRFELFQHPTRCQTLLRLHIRLNYTYFLENLIEHAPNLEQMSVEFDCSLGSYAPWKSNVDTLRHSKTSWFHKVRKSD